MLTLDQAVTHYLSVERAEPTTLEYKRKLAPFLAFIGSRPLSSITEPDVLDYVQHLRARVTRRGGRPLKDTTILHHITVLKAFFTWCVDGAYLTSSPARRVKVRQRVNLSERSRAIPPDELARMLEYARVTSPRNYALLMFMADTGCRVGGLVSLTLPNLHLDEGRALLLEKGERPHVAMFGAATADALRAWLVERPPVQHDSVWTGKRPDFAPMARGGVANIIRAVSRKVHASRDWSPHAIRHAVGEALAKRGVPAPMIAAKLGHADVLTTIKFYLPQDSAYLRQISDQYALIAVQPDQPKKSARIIQFRSAANE